MCWNSARCTSTDVWPLATRVSPGTTHAVLNNLKFADADVQEIMNAWRRDVDKWMHPETLAVYKKSPKWHSMGKPAFSVPRIVSVAASSCSEASSRYLSSAQKDRPTLYNPAPSPSQMSFAS